MIEYMENTPSRSGFGLKIPKITSFIIRSISNWQESKFSLVSLKSLWWPFRWKIHFHRNTMFERLVTLGLDRAIVKLWVSSIWFFQNCIHHTPSCFRSIHCHSKFSTSLRLKLFTVSLTSIQFRHKSSIACIIRIQMFCWARQQGQERQLLLRLPCSEYSSNIQRLRWFTLLPWKHWWRSG